MVLTYDQEVSLESIKQVNKLSLLDKQLELAIKTHEMEMTRLKFIADNNLKAINL